MTVILPIVIFVAILLIAIGACMPLFARDPVQARLAQFAERPRSLEELELEQPFSERVLRPLAQMLAGQILRVRRNRDTRQQERQAATIQTRLNLAGNPHRWSPTDFLGVKGMVALGVGGALFLLTSAGGQPALALLFGGGAGLLGFLAPDLYLRQLTGRRQKEIQRSLPDCLDLLCICVEAGLGFDGALTRLVEKSNTTLAREFGRVLAELRVGRPRREALKDVINRTEVPDLANFISAVIQADQLGVSVTQVLAVQADQMRVLRRQRAEELANQAPLKMLFPMVLFIFPALCIVILGPLGPQLRPVA